jgi:hypothetical protein
MDFSIGSQEYFLTLHYYGNIKGLSGLSEGNDQIYSEGDSLPSWSCVAWKGKVDLKNWRSGYDYIIAPKGGSLHFGDKISGLGSITFLYDLTATLPDGWRNTKNVFEHKSDHLA